MVRVRFLTPGPQIELQFENLLQSDNAHFSVESSEI